MDMFAGISRRSKNLLVDTKHAEQNSPRYLAVSGGEKC